MSTPYRDAAVVELDDAEEALAFWLRVEVDARARVRQLSLRAYWLEVDVSILAENLARRRARLAVLAELAAFDDEVDAATLAAQAPEVCSTLPARPALLDMAPMEPVQL